VITFFLARGEPAMTDADRDRVLDIIWRAMSEAAGGADIPMAAQLIADEALVVMDAVISASLQDTD
jgi:hypothetical protein